MKLEKIGAFHIISSDDSYIFNLGDGEDTTYDSSGNDTLRLSYEPKDIFFLKNETDLELICKNTEDKVTIKSWFSRPAYQIEEIHALNDYYITNNDIGQLIQALATFGENHNMAHDESKQYCASTADMVSNFWVKN